MNALVVFSLFITTGYAAHHHHTSAEVAEAKKLFHAMDFDGNGLLVEPEFHQVFTDFDTNKDGVIRVDEFILDWNSRNLGESSRVVKFFYNLDTNGDGVITLDPDVPRIFHFFDRDYSGTVDAPEFTQEWTKIAKA